MEELNQLLEFTLGTYRIRELEVQLGIISEKITNKIGVISHGKKLLDGATDFRTISNIVQALLEDVNQLSYLEIQRIDLCDKMENIMAENLMGSENKLAEATLDRLLESLVETHGKILEESKRVDKLKASLVKLMKELEGDNY
jgi:hypothetical protein